jgi:hypothetical protein
MSNYSKAIISGLAQFAGGLLFGETINLIQHQLFTKTDITSTSNGVVLDVASRASLNALVLTTGFESIQNYLGANDPTGGFLFFLGLIAPQDELFKATDRLASAFSSTNPIKV